MSRSYRPHLVTVLWFSILPPLLPAAESSSSQPAKRFTTEIFDGATVELVGLGCRRDGRPSYWAPDGRPMTRLGPGSDVTDEGGIAVVLRVEPGQVSIGVDAQKGTTMQPLEGLRRVAGTDRWVGTIEQSETRRSVNLWVSITTPCWRTKYVVADAGGRGRSARILERKRVDDENCAVRMALDTDAWDETNGLGGERFLAIDESGKLYAARQKAVRLAAEIDLVFPIPLGQLAGVAHQQLVDPGALFENVSLRPGHRTAVWVGTYDYGEMPPRDTYRAGPSVGQPSNPRLTATLRGGRFVECLGVGRDMDEEIMWWTPQGGPAAVEGVGLADLGGWKRVVAFRPFGAISKLSVAAIRGERRQALETVFLASAGVWLARLDEMADEGVVHLAVQVGSEGWEPVFTIPLGEEHTGVGRQVNRDGIKRIVDLLPNERGGCTLRVYHDGSAIFRGARDFAAVDRSGKVHMEIASHPWAIGTNLTFDLAVDQIAGLARLRWPDRAEARFVNVLMQPGLNDEFRIEVDE